AGVRRAAGGKGVDSLLPGAARDVRAVGVMARGLAGLARLARMKLVKLVNMHEAKTTLSQLVELAERGEEIVIARAGRPVARIVAVRTGVKRRLGQWRGRVRMADDFDAPLPASELAVW